MNILVSATGNIQLQFKQPGIVTPTEVYNFRNNTENSEMSHQKSSS
jgi:hypothetical protein